MRNLLCFWLLVSGLLVVAAPPALAEVSPVTAVQEELPAEEQLLDEVLVAPVVLDGVTLFRVRGISALPADERAARIHRRIVELADDPAVDPKTITIQPQDDGVHLVINGRSFVTLYPVDADIEQAPLSLVAEGTRISVEHAIRKYREARSSRSLLTSTGILLGITLLAALLLYAVGALFGWLNRLVERVVKKRIEHIERASHRVIDAAQMWSWLGGLLRGLRALTLVAIVLTWLNSALGLYPWTRPFATSIFRLILDPLQTMGLGVLQSLPDLAFLVILVFIVRFVLRAIRTFFLRIDRGWIRLPSFDRDWAMPTYRIARILIIAFAVVVAYPYIPGSESAAFKGVSIFLGVIFSIGSSSFVANMLAGYSLTYRGAFREGDRVRIGEYTGDVVAVRALSTTLRSMKNEEINIPNSEVLSSAVVNYTTYQKERGVVLHTDVGIGYDTPWRQVEAMLKLAAARTPELEAEPEPYVLQTCMGDFTVTYQLNAFCHDTSRMASIYSALHANIQDVFNEYGVQIMSPNYEADPARPKVVPREQWYAAPAAAPEPGKDPA